MSIIHEALKKVQSNLQRSPDPAVPESAGAAPAPGAPEATVTQNAEPSRAPAPPKKSNPALTFALAAAVLAVIGYYAFAPNPAAQQVRSFVQQTIDGLKAASPVSPVVKFAQIVRPSAVKSLPQAPAFKLQGIMRNGQSTVALINDKIYQTGEEVNGAKILNISTDSITILRDGKEETLTVRH